MKRIVAFLLVTFLVGAGVGRAEDHPDIAVIKKMEQERILAGVRKDVEAIGAATAADYLQIDFDGKLLDKPSALRRIKGSEIQLESNTIDEMLVRIFDNTAVVIARSTPKGTIHGKEFGRPIRYSRVYVKRDGRWQVTMFQMTRIAEQGTPSTGRVMP